ncbi:predicted protein [Botrytis cinerea T4]|uniref:Uncharacterized protein n=1 Tax=Botryotinia fuckeliana (strain T4) TaxID=999810 RepID=G2YT74_BOTF4|nr:predicted protein [Botrytis cinerea T4]
MIVGPQEEKTPTAQKPVNHTRRSIHWPFYLAFRLKTTFIPSKSQEAITKLLASLDCEPSRVIATY